MIQRVIKALNDKRESLRNESKKEAKRLVQEWHDFKKQDTYLLNLNKNSLLKEISNAEYFKTPFYLFWDRKLKRELRINYQDVLSLHPEVADYNKLFIEKRLKQHKSLFDGGEKGQKYSLDVEQRTAVVKDDKHNLIIAAAGSGKTSVLVSKIAYITKRNDKIAPEKILALAFNNDAVNEIKQRLSAEFNIDGINVQTFHKLGLGIIREKIDKPIHLFEDGQDHRIKLKIKEFVDDCLKESKYQELWIEYLSEYLDEEEDEASFEEKEDYFNYIRNKRYTTLNNVKVKSISEKDIANFLFRNQIKFEYEYRADWVSSRGNKDYHPDFYLPDYDTYIEHWGLDKTNRVPDWFEGKNPTEIYLKKKEWKLQQFAKYNKKLVECWDYERKEGNLIQNLKNPLQKQWLSHLVQVYRKHNHNLICPIFAWLYALLHNLYPKFLFL
jgi:DNA helicase IV